MAGAGRIVKYPHPKISAQVLAKSDYGNIKGYPLGFNSPSLGAGGVTFQL